ncbi:hypothetical protein DOS77_08545 [Staphylococcus felis]|uniref:hypothetical protein n=1 Tax=Staphylococcus felis TaxID=46127 RepID=UPI000E234285|nr:hypothetical protein [Staphylococcus felis]REH76775.1 hypothetical protein DOS60_07290 [Staphylococcus felis]REH97814.1 hypothetical protein DOS67_02565 [Staphylococcus felis]REI02332.1 hypothetical protein DOS62_11090 [Staphylococcus felis]REI12932.1 hypothetical protein DOS66_01445 [Staphylococcus felis]REI21028.1 hypothetical protein DOS77_08545 [Staphylococcus felis]
MSDVIPFPKLKEKLVRDITESVQDENYEAAYDVINEYESYFELTDKLAILKCEVLWELSAYLELKEEANILLTLGYKPYDIYMTYYVKSLFELEQYQSVIDIIEQVLDEVTEHQTRMTLLPIKDRARSKLDERKDYMAYRLQQFHSLNQHEQMQLILSLIDDNAYQFTESISYLFNTSFMPTHIQSLMLEYLRLAEYDRCVSVTKASKTITVIPSKLIGLEHSQFKRIVVPEVIALLEEHIPSLVQEAYIHLNTHNIALYPLDIEEVASIKEWKEAYLLYFKEMIGQMDESEYAQQTLVELIKSLNT